MFLKVAADSVSKTLFFKQKNEKVKKMIKSTTFNPFFGAFLLASGKILKGFLIEQNLKIIPGTKNQNRLGRISNAARKTEKVTF